MDSDEGVAVVDLDACAPLVETNLQALTVVGAPIWFFFVRAVYPKRMRNFVGTIFVIYRFGMRKLAGISISKTLALVGVCHLLPVVRTGDGRRAFGTCGATNQQKQAKEGLHCESLGRQHTTKVTLLVQLLCTRR